MLWKCPTYDGLKGLNWEQLLATFDWLEDMKTVQQDPIWHAEGDVFTHTKMVVDALCGLEEFQQLEEQERHILVMAALLHDVEKRSTTTTEIIDGKERIVSPRHAKRGEFTARQLLYKDIPTPFEIREQIAKLVRWHGLPLWVLERTNPAKEVINASLVLNTNLLYLLAKADVLGRICEDQEERLLDVDLFKELCIEQDCYGKARHFESNYGRYLYLNRPAVAPNYIPFDDLKFEVYCLCALPGAGKDTFIKQHLDLPVLSLDDIRREHKIDPRDKKRNGQVVQLGKEKAKAYMRTGQSFVFNATNITKDMRQRWISLFTSYRGRVKIIYLEVPYATLIKQNHNREYKVPLPVVERLLTKLEIPTPNEAHDLEFHILQ